MTEASNIYTDETVFSNNEKDFSETDEDLVSDRVHILANDIYKEFEILINKFGPGTVDGIMPSIISMLETMDKLYTNKDELNLQLDLIREDQSELYIHYEREKTYRRLAEEKNNHLEDQFDADKRQLEERIELLESNNKISEMRLKNSRDLITRIEEKEIEMKKEYNALQLRYSELLRMKFDGSNRYHSLNSTHTNDDPPSRRHSPKVVRKLLIENIDDESISEISLNCPNIDTEVASTQNIDPGNETNLKEELELVTDTAYQFADAVTSTKNLSLSMKEELSESFPVPHQDLTDDDDNISGGEFDDLFMAKEVEFLIKENQELTETKMALNVLKDDLITKLDEMTGELCILREDLRSTTILKKQYKIKAQEFEKKCHALSELLEEKDKRLSEFEENIHDNEPFSQTDSVKIKTKFTRQEVSRILQEKNKYKEELLELQETMRYQSIIIDRHNTKSKGGKLWNLFGNFLSSATAFTTEAFIGTGNEVTVTQLNRNFSHHGSRTRSHPHGHISANHPPPHRSPKRPSRDSNPLLDNPDVHSNYSSIELVPIEMRYRRCYNVTDTSL